MKSKWIKTFEERPNARARLICFHHAGGDAQYFAQWNRDLPPEIELSAVQLPGRGTRMSEPLVTDPDELRKLVNAHVSPLLDRPAFVLGNSFGCFVAFEWLRELRRSGGPLPLRFLALACRAPQLPRRAELEISTEDPAEFVKAMGALYGGLPGSVMKDERFALAIAKIFMADIALVRRNVYAPEPPLGLPISAFRGAEDVRISPESIEGWAAQTSAGITFREYPGKHFFVEQSRAAFMSDLIGDLRSDLAGL